MIFSEEFNKYYLYIICIISWNNVLYTYIYIMHVFYQLLHDYTALFIQEGRHVREFINLVLLLLLCVWNSLLDIYLSFVYT